MKNLLKKRSDKKASLAEKNLAKTIRHFESIGIHVYWKLDAEGNIIGITTDPRVAKEKGYIRAFVC